jgi:hypothetical protein
MIVIITVIVINTIDAISSFNIELILFHLTFYFESFTNSYV